MANVDSRHICDLCKERLDDGSHQPVALTCGHSFCRPCLQYLHNTQAPLHCPKVDCQCIHTGMQPNELPINYHLLNILHSLSDGNEQTQLSAESKDKKLNNVSKNYNNLDDASDNEHKKLKCKKFDGVKREEKDIGEDDKTRPKVNKSVNDIESCVIDVPENSISNTKPIWQIVYVVILLAFALAFATLSCKVFVYWVFKSMGYTDKGIIKGSSAAQFQSKLAKANNGSIPADSTHSYYQRAAMKGIDTIDEFGIFIVAFLIFLFLGAFIFCFIWKESCAECLTFCRNVKEKFQKGNNSGSNISSVEQINEPCIKDTLISEQEAHCPKSRDKFDRTPSLTVTITTTAVENIPLVKS